MTTFTAWFQRAIVPKVSQQKPSLSNSKWRSSSSTEKGLFQGSKLGVCCIRPMGGFWTKPSMPVDKYPRWTLPMVSELSTETTPNPHIAWYLRGITLKADNFSHIGDTQFSSQVILKAVLDVQGFFLLFFHRAFSASLGFLPLNVWI